MFNYDVILAGHGIVNDVGRATTWKRKCQAPCTNKSVENEGPSKNMGFNGKTVERFRTIENKNIVLNLSEKLS